MKTKKKERVKGMEKNEKYTERLVGGRDGEEKKEREGGEGRGKEYEVYIIKDYTRMK